MPDRPNPFLGVGGRKAGATLLAPGPQPQTPIIQPKHIHGGYATAYIRDIPEQVVVDFRAYCARRDYKLRHAVLCLMRWATTNNINLHPLYKDEPGDGAIHIRAVPIYTSRNFHAYCMKRGYLIRAAVAALMVWAATEDLELAGCIR